VVKTFAEIVANVSIPECLLALVKVVEDNSGISVTFNLQRGGKMQRYFHILPLALEQGVYT
jgi:hypothetical protein